MNTDWESKIRVRNSANPAIAALLPEKRPFSWSYQRSSASIRGTNFEKLTPSELETYPWEIQIRSLTSDYESIVDTDTQGAGYFGPGVTFGTGANRVITHSVPREHPVSLAAYQHSIANGLQVGEPGQSSVSSRILQPGTSFAIGNSLASSVIPMARTEAQMDSGSPLADHSYLANTVLWDDWFLSGISPQTYSSFATTRSHEQVALDFFQSEEGLPTTKYKSDPGGTLPQDLVDNILAAAPNDEVALSLSAAHILVDGMFNVNSTSVEAWKSVLGSLRNSPSPAQDGSGVDTTATNDGTTQNGKTPTTGLLTPRHVEIDEQTLEDPQEDSQWIGYRVLEDVDITPLAEAIVEQVKSRGPFLSLSDFVNRR